MDTIPEETALEERIQKLEQRVGLLEGRSDRGHLSFHPVAPFLLGCSALVFAYFGMGLLQHYYHFLFAGLLIALFYHRGFLLLAPGRWRWPQLIVNVAILTAIFKLLIGGGKRYPLDWLKAPAIVKAPPAGEGSWYNLVPDIAVQWQGIPHISDWSVDLTKIQILLLIATLAGALFRFQPFTSITALALLIVSIPVYLQFNWDWVVLFLVLGSVSLYLQTRVNPATRNPPAPAGGDSTDRNWS